MRVIISDNFKKLAGADYNIQPGFKGKDSDPPSQSRLLSKSVNGIPSKDDVKEKWERRKKKRRKPAKKFNPETDGFPKASL